MRAVFFPFLLVMTCAAAQTKIDSSYNNGYYQGRMELFKSLPVQKGALVFLGNSLTERGQWGELLPGKRIMNRGIGGDNTFGVLARLGDVLQCKPKKIFLLVGLNDVGRNHPVALIAANYRRIVATMRKASPGTKIYLQSVLPLNGRLLKAAYLVGKQDSILLLNKAIEAVASETGSVFVNLHPLFATTNGELKEEYTTDGIHVNPAAYVDWIAFLKQKRYL